MNDIKAILSLYHFNIQFVAGAVHTYDEIIFESFEPFLDLYLAHPKWKCDLELQGYFLEYLKEHYPHIIDKLRLLINRGQIELVSAHYSDQIWLAYPRYDMVKSVTINDSLLSELNIKRSSVFFTQENFFGEGAFSFMKEYGFKIATITKDYYEYLHGEEKLYPYYEYNDIIVLIATPPRRRRPIVNEYEDVKWTWVWYGDGEPLLTGRSPMFSKSLTYREDLRLQFEQIIEDLEKHGFTMYTISEYVDMLKKQGLAPVRLSRIVDGSWNMRVSLGVFMWMGVYMNPYERDCEARSLTFKSRKYLLACETLLNYARNQGLNIDKESFLIREGWKHQLRAEASDSTGWFPALVEAFYSDIEAKAALAHARYVITLLKKKLGFKGKLTVNTFTGEISSKSLEEKRNISKAHPPIPLQVIGASSYELECYRVERDQYTIDLRFTPELMVSFVGVIFPLLSDEIGYSPALEEDRLVYINLNDFKFERISLPLPNGLISLNKDTFIIKHNEYMHVAFSIDKSLRGCGFILRTPPQRSFSWKLTIFKGSEKEALELAKRINVFPTVTI